MRNRLYDARDEAYRAIEAKDYETARGVMIEALSTLAGPRFEFGRLDFERALERMGGDDEYAKCRLIGHDTGRGIDCRRCGMDFS